MVVVCHKLLSAGFLRQRKHRQPEVRLGGGRCSARSARRACLSSDTAVLRRIASATSSSVERPSAPGTPSAKEGRLSAHHEMTRLTQRSGRCASESAAIFSLSASLCARICAISSMLSTVTPVSIDASSRCSAPCRETMDESVFGHMKRMFCVSSTLRSTHTCPGSSSDSSSTSEQKSSSCMCPRSSMSIASWSYSTPSGAASLTAFVAPADGPPPTPSRSFASPIAHQSFSRKVAPSSPVTSGPSQPRLGVAPSRSGTPRSHRTRTPCAHARSSSVSCCEVRKMCGIITRLCSLTITLKPDGVETTRRMPR
mmetsp:Transcript_34439/g.102890  ORF Transcript_34439/g.102890 Transcript_34439/m.102890 type:complete len:312 (-) Transcript_34439:11-946(-)